MFLGNQPGEPVCTGATAQVSTTKHYPSCSRVWCTNLDDCKQTLKLLLANGLCMKARQARLALNLTTHNHLEVREAVSSLSGLQKCYNFLDSEGVARAKEINRLQQRVRQAKRIPGGEKASLQHQLNVLQKEHKLQNLISECDLRRKDICAALREGGS